MDPDTNHYSAYYKAVKKHRDSWLHQTPSWHIIGYRDGWASGRGYGGEVEEGDFDYGSFVPCEERYGNSNARWDANDLGDWFICNESPISTDAAWMEWSEWSVCSDDCDSKDSLRHRSRVCDSSKITDCQGKPFVIEKCPECPSPTDDYTSTYYYSPTTTDYYNVTTTYVEPICLFDDMEEGLEITSYIKLVYHSEIKGRCCIPSIICSQSMVCI